MSFEHQKPAQMSIFSERTANAEQPQSNPEVVAQTEAKITPEVIETPLKQDLLEYYERQAEFHERYQVGQNKFNLFTQTKSDEPAYRAVNGDKSTMHALSFRRSPEDIKYAAQRHRENLGRIALKFADLAAAPTVKAHFRAQIESQDISEPQKIAKMERSSQDVDYFVGGQAMLGAFKNKFINSPDAAKNRQKANSNLKKGIKLQREMRAKMKTDNLGVSRPTYLDK